MAHTISSCFIAAFLLTLFTAVHASYRPLNPLEQLQKRNPYYGGYALPEPSLGCPANLETCDGNFCCPTGTWCSPAINGPYCCPTGKVLISPLPALLSLLIFSSPHLHPPKVHCLCHKVKHNADTKQKPIAIHRLRIYPPVPILPGASSTMYTCGAAQGPTLVFMVLNVLGMMLRFLRISMLI
jgi:hypothetical protein